ncbi:hypothetical protein NW759_008692 [Fusarium solani]|nr:hypothetical protein NW759_008692 [Fusarium solani]
MCTTTFAKWHCSLCDCLIGFDQNEEICEHVMDREPEKCWKEIKSEKQNAILPCEECQEKLTQEQKRKYDKE